MQKGKKIVVEQIKKEYQNREADEEYKAKQIRSFQDLNFLSKEQIDDTIINKKILRQIPKANELYKQKYRLSEPAKLALNLKFADLPHFTGQIPKREELQLRSPKRNNPLGYQYCVQREELYKLFEDESTIVYRKFDKANYKSENFNIIYCDLKKYIQAQQSYDLMGEYIAVNNNSINISKSNTTNANNNNTNISNNNNVTNSSSSSNNNNNNTRITASTNNNSYATSSSNNQSGASYQRSGQQNPTNAIESHEPTNNNTQQLNSQEIINNYNEEIKLEPFYQKKSEDDNTLIFESRFESGNLSLVGKVSDTEYNLLLQNDINSKGHTQWFFFKMTNTKKGAVIKFNILNLGKQDSLYNMGMKIMVHSKLISEKENKGWHRSCSDIQYFKTKFVRNQDEMKPYFSLSFTYEFKYSNDEVYFAYNYPYTYTDLQKYLISLENDPTKTHLIKRKLLCRTLAGNRVDILTITESEGKNKSPSQKQGIVLSARVHAGETVSSFVMKGIIDFLVSPHPTAVEMRSRFVFKIIPMLNPDGVIHGNYRCSLSGSDLNRKWVKPSQYLHPEIFYFKKLIINFSSTIDMLLFCDLHGHSMKKNIFVYGCHDESQPYACRELPYLISKLYKPFQFEDCNFLVKEDKKGTARVALWEDLQIPNIFTLESSFCGPSYDNIHFGSDDFVKMGQYFCKALNIYFKPNEKSLSDNRQIQGAGNGGPSPQIQGTKNSDLDKTVGNIQNNKDGEKNGKDQDGQNKDDELNQMLKTEGDYNQPSYLQNSSQLYRQNSEQINKSNLLSDLYKNDCLANKGMNDESVGSESAPSDDDLDLTQFTKGLPKVKPQQQRVSNNYNVSPPKQKLPINNNPEKMVSKSKQKYLSTRQSPEKMTSPKKSVSTHNQPKQKLYPSLNIKEFKIQMNTSPQNIFAKRFSNIMQQKEVMENKLFKQNILCQKNLVIVDKNQKPIHVKNIVLEGQLLSEILNNSSILEQQQRDFLDRIAAEQKLKLPAPSNQTVHLKRENLQIPKIVEMNGGTNGGTNGAETSQNKHQNQSVIYNSGQKGTQQNFCQEQNIPTTRRDEFLYHQYQDTRILGNHPINKYKTKIVQGGECIGNDSSQKQDQRLGTPKYTDLPQLKNSQICSNNQIVNNGNENSIYNNTISSNYNLNLNSNLSQINWNCSNNSNTNNNYNGNLKESSRLQGTTNQLSNGQLKQNEQECLGKNEKKIKSNFHGAVGINGINSQRDSMIQSQVTKQKRAFSIDNNQQTSILPSLQQQLQQSQQLQQQQQQQQLKQQELYDQGNSNQNTKRNEKYSIKQQKNPNFLVQLSFQPNKNNYQQQCLHGGDFKQLENFQDQTIYNKYSLNNTQIFYNVGSVEQNSNNKKKKKLYSLNHNNKNNNNNNINNNANSNCENTVRDNQNHNFQNAYHYAESKNGFGGVGGVGGVIKQPASFQFNNRSKRMSVDQDQGQNHLDSKNQQQFQQQMQFANNTAINFSYYKQYQEMYNLVNANLLAKKLKEEKKKNQVQLQNQVANNLLIQEFDAVQSQQNKRHFTQPNEQQRQYQNNQKTAFENE